jgi:hypothetical protein
MLALKYDDIIVDYMIQKTYNNIKVGLKCRAWVVQIAIGLLIWFKNCYLIKLVKTYKEEDYEEAITVINPYHEKHVERGIDFRRMGGYQNRRTWVGYNVLCSVLIS